MWENNLESSEKDETSPIPFDFPGEKSLDNQGKIDEKDDESQEKDHTINSSDVAKQLRRLLIDNTGKFLENWNPDKSRRKTRKLTRKIYSETARRNSLYDDDGIFKKDNADFCDCLEDDCPGCYFPCSKCGSVKCGHECRKNRKWTYDSVEVEGTDGTVVFKNKHK